MNKEKEHLEKIKKAQDELGATKSPLRAKDLQKYIKRLKRELVEYRRYRREYVGGR